MADLLLTDSEQSALCALVAAEPGPGRSPSREVLANVAVLIPEQPISARDLAILRILGPVLERLLPDRSPSLSVGLTAQEHRVLHLVAQGFSNAEVAARLYVAPCTVRKHLEHSFRKLGVTNRLAAVIAYEGGTPTATGTKDSPERE